MMMVLRLVIFTVSASIVKNHPPCQFFQRDGLILGDKHYRIPDFHQTDVSLDVPVPPHSCTLNLSIALFKFMDSTSPHLKLRITCYHMEVHILPFTSDIDQYMKTLDLTLVQCNTSYGDISNIVPEKLVGFHFINCNISISTAQNRTLTCHGVAKLLAIGFDGCFNEILWRQLVSCDNVLNNVYWLSIQLTPFYLIRDVYKFKRLQYLKLNEIGLDSFPKRHLSYAELESNETYPDVFTYYAPFSNTFNDFEYVVMRVIDFSHNIIDMLPSELAFSYIPVHMLNLNNNRIRRLSSSLLKTIRHLVQIDFSHNMIETIPKNIFDGLTTLQNIYFYSNLLSSIPKLLFQGLVLLLQVNFADNRLTTLDPHLFSINHRYISTMSLNFAGNRLKVIPDDLFKDVKVSSLDLKNNSITEIPYEILTHGDLRHLDLSLNPINGSALAKIALKFLDAGVPRDAVPKVLDLSYCDISYIPDGRNFSTAEIASYQLFFSTFQVLLHNSPINCSCDMRIFVIDLLAAIGFSTENRSLWTKYHVDENFFDSWKCRYPEEYRGFEMIKLPTSEFYCRVMIMTCPDDCECYWYEDERFLIDCSNTKYTDIPNDLDIPDFSNPNFFRIHTINVKEIYSTIAKRQNSTKIHLKFSHADLRKVSHNNYLSLVTNLDVSFNKLTSISENVIHAFKDNINLTLDLSNNQISYLPKEIMSLDLKQIRLSNNPYVCDCNSLWMKIWLRDRRVPVSDWDDITCLDINKQGRVFVDVPDDDFICPPRFDTVKKVLLPAIGIGGGVIFVLVSCILLYMYRQEVKVLLFVYFGMHPFDEDETKYVEIESTDVFIAHDEAVFNSSNLEKLGKFLKERQLCVSLLSHDRLIGYTYYENIRQLIEHSKRIIIYIETESDMKRNWFTTCWTLTKEKIKRTRTNYAILVYAGKQALHIKDKELKRYVSHDRFIKMNERIALKKISYLMPKKLKGNAKVDNGRAKGEIDVLTTQTSNEIVPQVFEETGKLRWSVFVSYDSEDFLFVRFNLMPLLEKRGLILHIPDRDFDVGVPIERNIVQAIDGSKHTLFILSKANFSDEWRRFVFNLAREKSVGEKSNHLILALKTDALYEELTDDLKSYVETFMCLKLEDPLFSHVLINTLTGSKFKNWNNSTSRSTSSSFVS